jgi:hypothetical protein
LLERLEESERNLAHQAALADRLGAMHSVAIDARKRFVQEMLSRVALDTSVLYERVHPGENVSLRSLELDPKYRASILQTANFHGTEGVAPQGYLSDAHMDTLGLCLWLAVVKQMGAADTVVVLDDVLTSLDDAHLGRLVDMIAEESRHFAQVIITTHYVPWRDHLARQAASGASVQVVELQPWSPQRGVQARPTVA